MASSKVADLATLVLAGQRQQEMDDFKQHLEERIANARRIAAAKIGKGPLPEYLLRKPEKVFHVELSPETSTETRVCRACGRERPLALFPPLRKFGDGSRNTSCQGCLDTYVKKSKEKAVREGVALPKQQLPTLQQRAERMWANARLRAWRANVPFIMRKKWIEDRLRAGICEVTGLPFSSYGRDSFMASIDREVPSKGYVESNCRMTVWIYNAAKGSGTHRDVVRMAKALIEADKAARTSKKLAAARAQAEAIRTALPRTADGDPEGALGMLLDILAKEEQP